MLINGGYIIFNQGIFNYLTEDENCDLEIGALERVAEDGQLQVFQHKGYWGCIDTVVDMNKMNELWKSGGGTLEIGGMRCQK
jgi:glucose-1-phosphate cytidylyltransferase